MLFKPIEWKTFIKDNLRLQIGFLMYGLAIGLMIQASLGNGPWSVLDVGVAALLGIQPGTVTQIVGVLVLIIALILREQIGWGTITNIIFIGFYLNLFLTWIPKINDNLILQIGMFLLAVALMGFASAIYIGAETGAGPRDSLMIGLSRRLGWSIRWARTSIEVIVVLLGWYIGMKAGVHDHVGVGTLAFALLIGPSVQFAFKTLGVDPHKKPEPEQ